MTKVYGTPQNPLDCIMCAGLTLEAARKNQRGGTPQQLMAYPWEFVCEQHLAQLRRWEGK